MSIPLVGDTSHNTKQIIVQKQKKGGWGEEGGQGGLCFGFFVDFFNNSFAKPKLNFIIR